MPGPDGPSRFYTAQVTGTQTPPVGTVALLFTDIEGSTRLARDLGPAWASVLQRHREILSEAIADHGGWVDSIEGDAFFATFDGASAAAQAAVAAQQELQAEPWPGGVGQVRVRMGLHVGWLERNQSGYVGLEIHRAARVAAAAHGGQVLLTEAARYLVGDWLPLDDLGVHRLKDFPHPARLFCAVIDGRGAADFPPPRTLGRAGPSAGRLPIPMTTFVGREAEVAKVAGLLERHRLVSVIGPGGSGKTRLAVEVARAIAARFADGVAWVDLSGIDRGGLVPGTIAAATRVQERSGDSMLTSLVAGLSSRQMLLVLDNCEQVADAVADTCARLLGECDDLWIMPTSQVALHVPGEARFRVPALPVPAEGEPASQIAAAAAVKLFVDRVLAADPDFVITDEVALTVADIVRHLDGMPLAVELAAARVPGMAVKDLLAGLTDRFAVLVGNSRGSPTRQHSLLAALDWSYHLLTTPDQKVYRRLAAFAAPFTLDAAATVCGPQARDVVPRLVESSLLVPPVEGADSRSRYRMLETMRAHADSLLTGNERTEAMNALLGWAVSEPFMIQSPSDFTVQDYVTVTYLEAEQDNLRYAIKWAAGHDPNAGLQLAVAMGPLSRIRGLYQDGLALLRGAQAVCPEPAGELAASCEFWLGTLSHHLAKFPEALAHYSRGIDLATTANSAVELVNALVERALVLGNTDRMDEAVDDATTALRIAREAEYAYGVVLALCDLGTLAWYREQFDEAVAMATQAQQAGDRGGHRPYTVLVVAYAGLHRFVEAEEAGQAGLAVVLSGGDRTWEAWYRIALAEVYSGSGRLSDAGRAIVEGLKLAWTCGDQIVVSNGLEAALRLCSISSRHLDAAVLLGAHASFAQAAGFGKSVTTDDVEDVINSVRKTLSHEQVATALSRGANLSASAAVQLACSLAAAGSGSDPNAPAAATKPTLSKREQELLDLVAQGSTDAQIAQQLFISIRTVRSHLDRIRDKTGCRRRADLTRLTLQAQLT